MLSGIFFVVFQSSLATMGEAVVIFDACGVHGANDSHGIRGRQQADGETVRLLLEVLHLQGEKYPAFGALSAVNVDLKTTSVTEDGFRATGTIRQAHGIRVNIVAKKMCDLALAEV